MSYWIFEHKNIFWINNQRFWADCQYVTVLDYILVPIEAPGWFPQKERIYASLLVYYTLRLTLAWRKVLYLWLKYSWQKRIIDQNNCSMLVTFASWMKVFSLIISNCKLKKKRMKCARKAQAANFATLLRGTRTRSATLLFHSLHSFE